MSVVVLPQPKEVTTVSSTTQRDKCHAEPEVVHNVWNIYRIKKLKQIVGNTLFKLARKKWFCPSLLLSTNYSFCSKTVSMGIKVQFGKDLVYVLCRWIL